MYVAGKVAGKEGIQLFSASLPPGAPLAAKGWTLTPSANDPTKVAMLAGQEASGVWDLRGGRHCPSYVKGWDPNGGTWVERIYYAGGADYVWGPYTIGYLEWDGERWVDQPQPAFLPNEDWEHGSVRAEPHLRRRQVEDVVCGRLQPAGPPGSWRVWLGKADPPAATGLWWTHSKTPSSDRPDWAEPVQIMTAEDQGWHAGPWKPCLRYGEANPSRMFVFFDGAYTRKEAGPFPYAFTLGCLETERPAPVATLKPK
jgi:hypothetical protein